MKKVLIAGFLTLTGSILLSAIMSAIGNNLVSAWVTPPGRYISTVLETEMMPFFLIAVLLLAIGIIILIVELFKNK